ncbi:MAG: helix-turn-helix domain-containing protein, partial [Terracidiphilus sp.]
MELLILLVSHRGELATRAEIAEKLWPGDVFVDTDHGINTAIRKLRHLLRDDADGPVFIQTVTGMGYRFIARVAQVDRDETNALTEVPIAPQVGSIQGLVSETTSALPAVHRPRRQWLWLVGIAVFAAFAALLLRRLDRADAPPPRITRSLQLTSDGREKFPLVVTDGVRVYFSELANEHWALSAVPISGGEPFAIPLPFPDAQVLN